MYPTLSHLIKALTGIWIPLPFATFGLFVAFSFLICAFFLKRELKRKEKEGQLFSFSDKSGNPIHPYETVGIMLIIAAISGLIGTLHAGNALQNLINQTSSSGLNAQGTSATNSSLSTTFGGQVIEVLSNGTLVIEAARQVEFSQQTQTIVLRGLVRPEDISQQNRQ